MIERIKTCLFRPRYTGKYLGDSFVKIIIIVLAFFAVVIVPVFLKSFYDSNLTIENERMIIREIISQDDTDIVFSGNKFSGTGQININVSNINVSILAEAPENAAYNVVYFVFLSDHYEVRYLNMQTNYASYANLNIEDFTMNDIKTGDLDAQNYFLALFKHAYKAYSEITSPQMVIFEGVQLFLVSIVVFFVTYLFTSGINDVVSNKMRMKLVLYSMPFYFIIQLFSYILIVPILSYIAVVIPYIYSTISIKSIMKIEIKK